ncbi:hypothetical protein B0A48_18884, partial [Cryoendolithus antarcticus]
MALPFGSTIPLWLEGKEITTSTTYDVISSAAGKVLYKSSYASVQDAENAIRSAQMAFELWSQTKPSVRRNILLRAAGILDERNERAALYCKNGKSAMVLREPYGVVLSIAPWNAPYMLALRACLGPLAMGNTVILKGSEASPSAYWEIASILHEAGLPAGCPNTISHRPQDAALITTAVIASPPIRKVTFTGSTKTGAIITSQAAKLLKPTLMELGGKAPTIVCEDTDLSQAALGCTLGAFLHSGQICMSTERILVCEEVAAKFKEALKGTLEAVFGDPNGLVLVNEHSVLKNKQLLEDAISKGAKVVYGDPHHQTESRTSVRPVVVEGVHNGMDIYHTESFGPTVSVIVVRSDEEAIKIAKDTDYGLSAAVFTEDLRRGLIIAKRIKSGAVQINSMSVHDESALPHGRYKKS